MRCQTASRLPSGWSLRLLNFSCFTASSGHLPCDLRRLVNLKVRLIRVIVWRLLQHLLVVDDHLSKVLKLGHFELRRHHCILRWRHHYWLAWVRLRWHRVENLTFCCLLILWLLIYGQEVSCVGHSMRLEASILGLDHLRLVVYCAEIWLLECKLTLSLKTLRCGLLKGCLMLQAVLFLVLVEQMVGRLLGSERLESACLGLRIIFGMSFDEH